MDLTTEGLDLAFFLGQPEDSNLRIRKIADVGEIQSPLVRSLDKILKRGAAQGRFRKNVDPVEFYVTIASLCYFPVSNKHTLRATFNVPIDAEWLSRKADESADMLICYLAAGATVDSA